MTLEPSDTLGKCLILDPVSWNNGCISQGRLNAVTSNPNISVALKKCLSYLRQSPDGYLEGSCMQ